MNNINRWFLGFVALMGATGVMAGAFAAHGIQKVIQNPYLIQVFQTAVLYQMFHTLALLGVLALMVHGKANKALSIAGILMIVGTVLFSGSLYILSLASWAVGMITPVGGFFLIAAWITLGVAAVTYKK